MKKALFVLSVLLIFYIAAVIFTKPLAVAFVKRKIEQAIPDSTLSGVDIHLTYNPWSLLCQSAAGDILIKNFKHDKFNAQDIKSHLSWKGGYIYLDSLSGQVLNGNFNGTGNIKLGDPLKYILQLNFTTLNLARFVQDFELKDKFLLTGMLNGKITLSGVGQNIQVLNGNFTPEIIGGDLIIKDTQFLENMARSSNLPPNLVMDSFQNYHYNDGLVQMFMDHGDLNFEVSMEGAAGKRNLKVVLHDFNLN